MNATTYVDITAIVRKILITNKALQPPSGHIFCKRKLQLRKAFPTARSAQKGIDCLSSSCEWAWKIGVGMFSRGLFNFAVLYRDGRLMISRTMWLQRTTDHLCFFTEVLSSNMEHPICHVCRKLSRARLELWASFAFLNKVGVKYWRTYRSFAAVLSDGKNG